MFLWLSQFSPTSEKKCGWTKHVRRLWQICKVENEINTNVTSENNTNVIQNNRRSNCTGKISFYVTQQ